MQKTMRQWSDRKKLVETPLFNSYIFVKVMQHEIQTVLQTPGISWAIQHNGKPAILRENEYAMIQRFITSGFFIETEGITPEFAQGDKTTVLDGPLAGISGIMSGEANNQKLTVLLEGINQVIRVEISGKLLKKV
jgi:transcription antitermination factor NusG